MDRTVKFRLRDDELETLRSLAGPSENISAVLRRLIVEELVRRGDL